MNRSGRILSITLATIGAAQLLFPQFIAQLFALDKEASLFAVGVAVVAYGVWLGPLRFLTGSFTLRFLGIAAIIAGAASLNSPTLGGLRTNYLPIADMFMMIESGILLSIVGYEAKPQRRLSPMLLVSVVSQLMYRRLSRARHAAASTASPSH